MTTHHLSFSIPKSKIEDLIAAHLYAIGVAKHSEDIEFLNLGGLGESVNLEIKLNKEVEVKEDNG